MNEPIAIAVAARNGSAAKFTPIQPMPCISQPDVNEATTTTPKIEKSLSA